MSHLMHPLPAGKRWHAFASHSKRAGEKTPDLVRSIKSILGAKGFKVFFDQDDLRVITLDTLKAEIQASAAFFVFVDEVTFDSEWCRAEIQFAADNRVPIFTVINQNPYHKEIWRSSNAKHGVEGKSIIDMWYPKLEQLKPGLWKESAGHCFGAGTRQAIWYERNQAMHEAALGEIEAALLESSGEVPAAATAAAAQREVLHASSVLLMLATSKKWKMRHLALVLLGEDSYDLELRDKEGGPVRLRLPFGAGALDVSHGALRAEGRKFSSVGGAATAPAEDRIFTVLPKDADKSPWQLAAKSEGGVDRWMEELEAAGASVHDAPASAADAPAPATTPAAAVEAAVAGMLARPDSSRRQSQGIRRVLRALPAEEGAHNDTDAGQQAARECGGIDAIVAAARAHPGSKRVQAAAAEALWTLARNSDNLAVIAPECGIILEAMRRHPGVEGVQGHACSALWMLAYNDSMKVAIAQAGGIAYLLEAMRCHPGSEGVQVRACAALANLVTHNDGIKVAVAEAGGIAYLLQAMQCHPGSGSVQEYACSALGNLAVNDSIKVAIAQAGGIAYLLEAMRCHAGTEAVMRTACRALSKLAHNDSIKVAIVEADGIAYLLEAMRCHPLAECVQSQACRALWILSAHDGSEGSGIRFAIAQAGGIAAVLEAMRRHPDAKAVQGHACAALGNLAVGDDRIRVAIAEADGIAYLVQATQRHPGAEVVQQQARGALRNLAANEAIQIQLANLNILDQIR